MSSSTPEPFLRSLLAAGASVAFIGIALAATDNQGLGSWLTLGGLAVMIFGLHRFGRTGPDAPLDLSTEPGDPEPE